MLNKYAVTLSRTTEIQNSWHRGGPDCNSGNASAMKEGDGARCPQYRSDIPSPCGTQFDKDNCFVEIGNEFIAVRIAAYIRYITLHMNLMTFMSSGFCLRCWLLLAIHSAARG
jgi:hypothetical protein